MTTTPLLRLAGITKRFGDLVANDGISLTLARGEVLALLGENGAGKSTLMAILFGHYLADAGTVEVEGRALPPGDTRAALDAGIGMVHQHFTLADNLSVLDNVVLGTEPMAALRSRRAQARAKLLQVAQGAGLPVDPDARVADLSVGEQQRVEILKALYRGARVLVLDEPTAVLTPQEAQSLFTTLRALVAQGLAIIFISHKLDEVMALSQRVVVLRAGRVVAESATAATNPAELARWMVGQSVVAPERRLVSAARPGAPRLAVAGVAARGQRQQLHDVGFEILPGEVLGIAGVSGNGQALLAQVLSGLAAADAGTLTLDGQPLALRPAALVAQGVARVPEDRQAIGIVGDLPVWENLAAEALMAPGGARHTGDGDRPATQSTTASGAGPAASPHGALPGASGPASPTGPLARFGWVRGAAARAYAQQVLGAFDVRGATLGRRSRLLSGGNVQKLILGRVLQRADGRVPALILAHQPTWGLDIGAVAFVHGRLRAAAEAGSAVLLISDDLDEIELLADRIAVICHGRLTAAKPAADWTREALGLAMAGADGGAPGAVEAHAADRRGTAPLGSGTHRPPETRHAP